MNVLQGGGSAEYGQRPYFYIFFGPFPNGQWANCLLKMSVDIYNMY